MEFHGIVYGVMVLMATYLFTISLIADDASATNKSDYTAQGDQPTRCPEPLPIIIDLQTSALLMLHWQNDVVHPQGKFSKLWRKMIEEGNTISHTKSALEAARKSGMFIMFVNLGFQPGYPEVAMEMKQSNKGFYGMMVGQKMLQQGSWGCTNIDEFKPLQDEPIIYNYGTGVFEATPLERFLRNRGIKSLFLSGIATNYVVESTARAARDKGYENYVLMDCCNSSSQDLHCWPLANTLGHLAIVTDSAHFIKALEAIK